MVTPHPRSIGTLVALVRFYTLRLYLPGLALGLVANEDITSCTAAVRLKAIIRPPRPASLSATWCALATMASFHAHRPMRKLLSSGQTNYTLFGNTWTLLKVSFNPCGLQWFISNLTYQCDQLLTNSRTYLISSSLANPRSCVTSWPSDVLSPDLSLSYIILQC